MTRVCCGKRFVTMMAFEAHVRNTHPDFSSKPMSFTHERSKLKPDFNNPRINFKR